MPSAMPSASPSAIPSAIPYLRPSSRTSISLKIMMGFGITAGALLIIATAYRIHRDYVFCKKRIPLSHINFDDDDDNEMNNLL
jgi:hypothetical protein